MRGRHSVFLAFLCGGCSLAAAAAKPGVPRLDVSPRLAIEQMRGVPVRVQVRIPSPPPELSCPEVRIEWGEANTSTLEGDCVPCEAGPCPDFVSPARWMRYGGGDHEIRVRIRQGKKTYLLTELVSIKGTAE